MSPAPVYSDLIRKEHQAILRDERRVTELFRSIGSQKGVAESIGCSVNTAQKARDAWEIPPRPANMPMPVDLSDMTPREVLANPVARETMMYRVYSQIRMCPMFCRYIDEKSCPLPGSFSDDESDLEIGQMHPQCPIGFYYHSGRNGEGAVYKALAKAGLKLASRCAKQKEGGE